MVTHYFSNKWREFIKTVGFFSIILSVEVLWVMFLIWMLSTIPVVGKPLAFITGTISTFIIYYLMLLVKGSYSDWKLAYR